MGFAAAMAGRVFPESAELIAAGGTGVHDLANHSALVCPLNSASIVWDTSTRAIERM